MSSLPETSIDLCDYAKGKPCQIRVPEVCCFDPEKTVLCHDRMAGITGLNVKSADAWAAWGCSPCHDYVDGRTHKDVPHEHRRALLLDGVMRTQNELVRRGILRW